MSNTPDRAAIVSAVTAGKAIAAGARLSSVRIVAPGSETGEVVHLSDAEAVELTEALRSILARRIAI